MQDSSSPVLLMAGGTGGHVFPALACARALQARGVAVHWLGTRRGLESRVVPEANIDISYLSIWGLRGKGALTLALAPFKIARALWQALRILRRVKPRAVLSMGGFVAGPGGLAARLLGIPVFVHEQNAVPGMTNKLLARIARRVMQGFPDTFPAASGALTVGNPLRADILALPAQPPAAQVPLKVLVFGGSLGALVFNQTLPQVFPQLEQPIQLWQQTGRQHIERVKADYAALDAAHFLGHAPKITAFIDDMAAAYAWADVIICRAGALTVSELAQAGRAAILVPFPHAVDDHQTRNARFLAEAGGAILLPQPEFNPGSLAALLNRFSREPQQLRVMAEQARACARPDAVEQVVNTLLN